jgi:HlyD family secretion protein
MTATATIVTELRSGVLLVPNAALRFTPPLSAEGARGKSPSPPATNMGKQVWVLQGTPPSPSAIDVKVGPTDGMKTELSSELAVGTKVLTDIVEKP